MKKSCKGMLVAMAFMLALTGCQPQTQEKEPVIVSDLFEETEEKSDELALMITHEKGHYMTSDGAVELLAVDMATPRIIGGSQAGIEVINAKMEQERAETIERLEGKCSMEEGGMDSYMLQHANEDYKLYYEADLFMPYHYTRGYCIRRFDEDVLSMTEVSECFGAVGGTYVFGFTYDLQTGEPLLIENIATDIENFKVVCEEEILRQIKEQQNQGVEYYEGYEEYIGDILTNQTFYLTEKAVGFVAQEFVLQPYGAGGTYFEVPYEVLEEYMNPSYVPTEDAVKGTIAEEEVTLEDRLYELHFEFDVATPILNKILSGMGIRYMYGDIEQITDLSDEVMIGLIASAITDDYICEETWYVDSVGGYAIPQEVVDTYTMNLFGKTIDLLQLEAGQQYGMAMISQNHECIALVGDWGMSCPTYMIAGYEALADGTYRVNVKYGVTDFEEGNTTEYLLEKEFVFAPCEASEYGYVIVEME